MGTETVSKVKGKTNTALFKIQSSSTFWKTLSFINFPSKIFLQIFYVKTGIPEEIPGIPEVSITTKIPIYN